MSQTRSSNAAGGRFKRLLGWTVLMAIVFSAGLITGERLVRRESLAPLVAVGDQVDISAVASRDDDTKDAPQKKQPPTSFAFFDQLARRDTTSLSSRRSASHEPAEPTEPKHAEPKQDTASPKIAAKTAAKTAPEPASAATQQPPAQPAKLAARYTLQVAAHPDLDSAKSHMERLRKMGLEPHVVAATIPGKGKFYRVRVGKFHTMDEARTFQASLEAKNSLSTFVTPL